VLRCFFGGAVMEMVLALVFLGGGSFCLIIRSYHALWIGKTLEQMAVLSKRVENRDRSVTWNSGGE